MAEHLIEFSVQGIELFMHLGLRIEVAQLVRHGGS
jgi:hypothetical protein